jgi:hypothetical protein
MQRIHEIIFKNIDSLDCYERVFVHRNYGYLLAKNDKTR